MKPALIIVDMLKDTFRRHPESPIVLECKKFIPFLNDFIDLFHAKNYPVVFACDSFLPEDFIFRAGLKPHSLRGTEGSEPIDELHRSPSDHIVQKRRFSAFFKTDLDQTLRTLGVDRIFVSGIATNICVLTTALDAVSNDFSAVIMEQCCAAHNPEAHLAVIKAYKKTPLHPLLQVLNNKECLELLKAQ
ncbi:cysteine hydrolase family protein [Thermodesulforhabdus norvegica]|uniref:Nicotinamidase-related amidase n=1 Tax=Thermodesulforhabdus norvegica TaxID=39841 RepID=A0A1I4TT13_9BACT|nr:isochorismatase family cysteine hydrolase [Thermodesulforhabdus norvegica]SFM79864.1 Nicotinamidase-related amidase [Thermodesulforhabdus norvegica]